MKAWDVDSEGILVDGFNYAVNTWQWCLNSDISYDDRLPHSAVNFIVRNVL